ncbi:MAG: hypothetical protein D3916_11590, partial [Candidatus Electrothrix sp. MAN1_4]|nr:hypothetical protein [Candidatus Electrothrix sp. MAN1_4]
MGIIPSKGKDKVREQSTGGKEGVAFFFFLFTLFFAPLAFGTTEPWSMLTVEILVALTGLFFLQPFWERKGNRKVYYQVPGLLPLLFLLAWMFLQTIPLPSVIVRWVAPHIFSTYQPVLELSGQPEHWNWIPLTVNRKATLFEALRVSAYVLFYVLTVQLLTSGKRFMLTVKAVSWLVLCIALLALLQRMTAPDTLFWVRQLTGGKTAFGPWVYKNHYAGFMVMLFPLLLAQFILYRPSLDRCQTIREKILSFFSEHGATTHLIMGFGTIIVLVSVFLTQSRGGILSIICSFLFFFTVFFRRQRRGDKLSLLVIATGVLIIVGWYNWAPIWERFRSIIDLESTGIQDDRLLIWTDCLPILADFPLTGTGFATFVDIFPQYKTIPDSLLYEHAHNDFLEVLSDGGLLAGVLGLWFISTVLKTGYKGILVRRDNTLVLIAIGAFSGLVGLLSFSLVDFNLHNGANGLYFVFLCGLLVSARHTRRYYHNAPTLLPPVQVGQGGGSMVFMGVLFFLCALVCVQGKRVLAEKYYQQAKLVASLPTTELSAQREKLVTLLKRAKKTDPLTGLYAYALANIKKVEKENKEAVLFSSQAVMQQPMHFAYLQQLGQLLASVAPVRARHFMEIGFRRGQHKEKTFLAWAEFELSHYARSNRDNGLERLRKELEHDARLVSPLSPLLIKYQLDQQAITAVLPDDAPFHIQLGELYLKRGKQKKAVEQFEQALILD